MILLSPQVDHNVKCFPSSATMMMMSSVTLESPYTVYIVTIIMKSQCKLGWQMGPGSLWAPQSNHSLHSLVRFM